MAVCKIAYCHVTSFEDLPIQNVLYKKGEDGQRAVFFLNNKFYKIWDENHKKRNLFYRAYQEGFFDHISLIDTIIMDCVHNCRGYVMSKGVQVQITNEKNATYSMSQRGCYVHWNIDDAYFDQFIENMIQSLLNYQYVFIDFSPVNVIKFDNDYYIIDLESIVTLQEFYDFYTKNNSLYNFYLNSMPIKYQKCVHDVILRMHNTKNYK